mmetsp:Transcript_24299/g.41591  ORF Transcript_24299/g.41591 Transcript_24299/m.41591 type:complete len:391 (+) Transcript_24299:60-1232(+)|eukprot:CAMPEP_0183718374 /NCGR_PEP_ID=MMETSP0737-20130205/11648_1 /TAXON_ID=385413 /ORGANISM="Thalassiosira miniscula, Strain CCMP1093" /LENGTH=390 /DNA_ID=CAMNT_0025947923 /DNA_START=50 /DNA_END=1222 /DNA_ORIENTATION=-
MAASAKNNNDPNYKEKVEVEVDPKEEIPTAAEEECWDLPSDFDLYTKHEIKKVYYPTFTFTSSSAATANTSATTNHQPNESNGCALRNNNDNHDDDNDTTNDTPHRNQSQSFLIECIEPDTPLDINNTSTSSSQYDATGHCVWAGAFLLVQCIREVHQTLMIENIDIEDGTIGKEKKQLRMIEFGCGTGIGGLAMMILANANHNNHHCKNDNDESVIPLSHMCFTDNDPDALKVCQRNCNLNHLPPASYSIRQLTWGNEQDLHDLLSHEHEEHQLFDVALATDVLYDVDLIAPLFTTVAQCLQPSSRGIFILSHIPRACYNEGNPPEAVENLEQYIIDRAMEYELELMTILRPPEKDEEVIGGGGIAKEILDWCPASSFLGGGILIFRRM